MEYRRAVYYGVCALQSGEAWVGEVDRRVLPGNGRDGMRLGVEERMEENRVWGVSEERWVACEEESCQVWNGVGTEGSGSRPYSTQSTVLTGSIFQRQNQVRKVGIDIPGKWGKLNIVRII